MMDKTEMSLDDIIKAAKGSKKPVQPVRKGAATKGAASKAARPQQRPIRLKSSAVASTSNNKVLKGKGRGGITKPKPTKKNVKVWTEGKPRNQRALKATPKGNQRKPNKKAIIALKGNQPKGRTTLQKIREKNIQANKLKLAATVNNRKKNLAIANRRPEDGGKLFISNLESGVTSEDMRELFQDVGEIKSASVHYDIRGNSLRTANVNFSRKLDAEKAMTQYNSVALDGKPMVIQMISSGAPAVPVSVKDRIGAPRKGIRRP